MDSIKKLPDVTLVATTSVRIDEHLKAMLKCTEQIEFGKVLLISHQRPSNLPTNFDYAYYPKIENIMHFNHLMFEEVGAFIDTSHALFCQDHAYILRPDLWDDGWLEYDYIGSPWPVRKNSYIADNGERARVGNGGFSLRSKKLMDLPRHLGLKLTQEQGYWNEDGNICCYHRSKFLRAGIRYAPVEVAAHFSYENPVSENRGVASFGFHKYIQPAFT